MVDRNSGRTPGQQRDGRVALALLTPAALCLILVFAFPVVRIVEYSMRDKGRGQWVGFDNYNHILGDQVFRAALVHNAELLLVIPIVIFLAVLIAALLHEGIRGWRIWRAIVFVPYIVPVVVSGLLFAVLLGPDGPVNVVLTQTGMAQAAPNWLGEPLTALPAIGGVIIWREMGFAIVLFTARMLQVPSELIEAAALDGAGFWRRLRYITLPEISGVVAFYGGVIAIAMFSWVFSYVFVLTRGGPGFSTYVAEYYIYDRAFGYNQLGAAAAGAVLLLLTVAFFMSFYIRWLHRREAS